MMLASGQMKTLRGKCSGACLYQRILYYWASLMEVSCRTGSWTIQLTRIYSHMLLNCTILSFNTRIQILEQPPRADESTVIRINSQCHPESQRGPVAPGDAMLRCGSAWQICCPHRIFCFLWGKVKQHNVRLYIIKRLRIHRGAEYCRGYKKVMPFWSLRPLPIPALRLHSLVKRTFALCHLRSLEKPSQTGSNAVSFDDWSGLYSTRATLAQ